MQGFEGFLLKKWSKKGGRFLDSLTFCRFAMGGIFTTELDAEHKTFGYH